MHKKAKWWQLTQDAVPQAQLREIETIHATLGQRRGYDPHDLPSFVSPVHTPRARRQRFSSPTAALPSSSSRTSTTSTALVGSFGGSSSPPGGTEVPVVRTIRSAINPAHRSPPSMRFRTPKMNLCDWVPLLHLVASPSIQEIGRCSFCISRYTTYILG